MIDRIRKLQTFLTEMGFGHSVLALPPPTKLLLENKPIETDTALGVFAATIEEQEIVSVSRDLFMSGHYNVAVAEAFKAVEKYILDKSGVEEIGTAAMRKVFSKTSPKLYWSERRTTSERDEHEGYGHIYAGASLGVRNPTTHEFNWIDDEDEALELLIFAQHLIRKAKIAKSSQGL